MIKKFIFLRLILTIHSPFHILYTYISIFYKCKYMIIIGCIYDLVGMCVNICLSLGSKSLPMLHSQVGSSEPFLWSTWIIFRLSPLFYFSTNLASCGSAVLSVLKFTILLNLLACYSYLRIKFCKSTYLYKIYYLCGQWSRVDQI